MKKNRKFFAAKDEIFVQTSILPASEETCIGHFVQKSVRLLLIGGYLCCYNALNDQHHSHNDRHLATDNDYRNTGRLSISAYENSPVNNAIINRTINFFQRFRCWLEGM